MPRNASGTHNRLYDWTDDRDAGVLVLASRMDAEMDDMATSLSNSLAKDGQTTPTANLPMGGYKHTEVGNASARAQYAALGQVQDGTGLYGTTGGASLTYTLALNPTVTAYANGQTFRFKPAHTSVGPSTLNVDTVGAKTIQASNGRAISAGDLKVNEIYEATYDSTLDVFRVQNLNTTGEAKLYMQLTGLALGAGTATAPAHAAWTILDNDDGLWSTANSRIELSSIYHHMEMVLNFTVSASGVQPGVARLAKNGILNTGSGNLPRVWEAEANSSNVISEKSGAVVVTDWLNYSSAPYYAITFQNSGATTMGFEANLKFVARTKR
jgi:hypothetical protein